MEEYIILGFGTGCEPCNQLKALIAELLVPYQFIDAKVVNNPTTIILKKLVKDSTKDSVVPALFSKIGTTYVVRATGIADCSKYVKEHPLDD